MDPSKWAVRLRRLRAGETAALGGRSRYGVPGCDPSPFVCFFSGLEEPETMEGPARVARCSTAVVVSHAMDQQWTPLDTTYHERLWAFLRQKGQLLSHCQIPYTPWDYHICRSVDPPNHHPWPDRQSYGSPMERLGIIYCGGSKERPSHPRTSDGTSIGKKATRATMARQVHPKPSRPALGGG